METLILFYFYVVQIVALLGYIWFEFAELRSLIRHAENNIITQIQNEIRNKSTADNE